MRAVGRRARTETGKADYLAMERRWLSLARSYEFAERLSDFVGPFRRHNWPKR
jgi:hypothetical protein